MPFIAEYRRRVRHATHGLLIVASSYDAQIEMSDINWITIRCPHDGYQQFNLYIEHEKL